MLPSVKQSTNRRLLRLRELKPAGASFAVTSVTIYSRHGKRFWTPWWRRAPYCLPNRRLLFTKRHGVALQKTCLFISTIFSAKLSGPSLDVYQIVRYVASYRFVGKFKNRINSSFSLQSVLTVTNEAFRWLSHILEKYEFYFKTTHKSLVRILHLSVINYQFHVCYNKERRTLTQTNFSL